MRENTRRPAISIRDIEPEDYPLLGDFLWHAIFLPPGAEALPRDVIFQQEIYVYIDGFGGKPGDCGVVAEAGANASGRIVGAAWTRIIPAFGHIDDDTPELALSVLPEYRGQRVGTMLMTRLFALLRERGYARTSLAVQQKNAAVRFYERLGYTIVGRSAEEYIMVKEL